MSNLRSVQIWGLHVYSKNSACFFLFLSQVYSIHRLPVSQWDLCWDTALRKSFCASFSPTASVCSPSPSCAWNSPVSFDSGVRASFHFILLCLTSRCSLSLLLLLWKTHQLVKMILKINLKKNFSRIFCFLAYLFLLSFHFCWNAVESLVFSFFSYVGHYRILSRVPFPTWVPRVP